MRPFHGYSQKLACVIDRYLVDHAPILFDFPYDFILFWLARNHCLLLFDKGFQNFKNFVQLIDRGFDGLLLRVFYHRLFELEFIVDFYQILVDHFS